MTDPVTHIRPARRAMIIVAFLLSIAALRFAFAITMPMTFAAIIIAALWPMSRWLGRFMPSSAAYLLTILALIGVLGAFVAAVYLSVGQVTGVMGTQWAGIERSYDNIARFAGAHGVPLTRAIDRGRIVSMVQTLAGGVYSFITYVGFIGLLVMLGLPEVPRLKVKLGSLLDSDSRRGMITSAEEISEQVRRYLGTTLATSILTGVVSALWSWMTGLELALVWGLLNFLLNFIPVIGNIVGIVPPVVYAFIQFGGAEMPIVVLTGFVVLQLTISNVVYPILQGKLLSLSPLAIIVAMTFWSWVWGLAGALIAVPLTAAIVIVCGRVEQTRWIATLLSR